MQTENLNLPPKGFQLIPSQRGGEARPAMISSGR